MFTYCYGPVPKGFELRTDCGEDVCVSPDHIVAVPISNKRDDYTNGIFLRDHLTDEDISYFVQSIPGLAENQEPETPTIH